MTPIDDNPMPPPPSKKKDGETLTQDLVSAIEREAMSLVDFVAHERGIGRRAATPIVLQMIRDLKKPKTEGDR
jgi:hypothetical protein